MSHKYIEKSFLYLILLSVLLHLAAFGVVSLIPPDPQSIPKEFTVVDLKDIPEPPPAVKQEPKPLPKPQPTPVPAPKSKQLPRPLQIPFLANPKLPPEKPAPPAAKEAPKKAPDLPGKTEPNQQAAKSPGQAESVAKRGEGFLKPRIEEKNELAKFFPSARKMGSFEDEYRKKYRGAEQGDTRLMDTDDPLVAVYTSRLLIAANDSLHIEDRKRTIRHKGVGALLVTINRQGTIENVRILESTKNGALDELAVSSIMKTGYVGPLPKKWPHEKLNLIWLIYSREERLPH